MERDGWSRIVPVVAVVFALSWAKSVLIPIVLSILLSYALEPVVVRMERGHIRRAFGVPLLLLGLAGIAGTTGYAIRGEAAAFVGRMPGALHTVSEAITELYNGDLSQPGTLARLKDAAHELETATRGTAAPPDGVADVRVEQQTFRWSDWLWKGSQSAAEFAGQMFAVLCITYCLLAAGDLYKRKLVRLVPTMSDKKVTVQILDEIDRQIERFLLARLVISVFVGVAVAITFHFAGMHEAGVWGVIAALAYTIPMVGSALFLCAAAIAGFVQFGTIGAMIGVAGLCLVIGVIEGNVLTPWLMSRVGEMNPAAVFVSLIFWGWLWGGWGLLLAVPITVSVKTLCERIPDYHPVAEILKAS